MTYLNTNDRTSKTPNYEKFQPLGRVSSLFGVFMGFVKNTSDIQDMGRLQVWIPEFGSAPDDSAGWITVSYCSPYAGATNDATISNSDLESFDGTQTSYGMWMVPPDINNKVIVMFINGDSARGIWIGSLYDQYMNSMVPGNADTTNNYQYNGKNVPTAEYNKNDSTVTIPDAATKPYNQTKFRGIGNQGLINDTIRSVTNSSGRREAPSQVFGISTPGPIINSSKPFDEARRAGGSAFVMDDNTSNEYIQFTTKSGAQLHINETNGFVYMINRDGTGWVQMDKDGNIDIFGAKDISCRAQRDINLRADRNVNIEAGQNVFIKAAQDTIQGTTTFTYNVNNSPSTKTIPVWNNVGEGNGSGGNVVIEALNDIHTTADTDILFTATNGNINNVAGTGFLATTQNGGVDINSNIGIKLTAGGAFDINSSGNVRVSSDGSLNFIGSDDIILCTEADINLKAADSIYTAAVNDIDIVSSNFNVISDAIFSDTIGVVGSVTVQGDVDIGGAMMQNTGDTVDAPTTPDLATAQAALPASSATSAEVKSLLDKINILSTWKSSLTYPNWQANVAYKVGSVVTNNNALYINPLAVPASPTFNTTLWNTFVPEDKFVRNSAGIQTTVTRFPTYEPCPEHAGFSSANISGYTPMITKDNSTYMGSGGPANDTSSTPAAAVDPGSNNTIIPADSIADSQISKDINMAAFECQLKIHEGYKLFVYNDSRGLPTAGIGHLLRANELSLFPVGSPVSSTQVDTWFQHDCAASIKGAQNLVNTSWGNLSDIRKRAICDLVYNLGQGGVSKFVKFLAAMNAQDFNTAGQELKNSKWYTQVGQRGPKVITMIVQNVDPNGCDKKFPG